MDEKQLLSAISDLMDSKLKTALEPVNERLTQMDDHLTQVDGRLTQMDERLERLEEDSKITRNAVNTLLVWAEEAQVQVQIPLFKKAE